MEKKNASEVKIQSYKNHINTLMLSAKKKNRKLNQYNGFVGKLLSQGRITKKKSKNSLTKN